MKRILTAALAALMCAAAAFAGPRQEVLLENLPESSRWYPGAKVLDEILTENGMPHTFYTKDGGHTWSNWRIFLNEMLPLLF